MKKLIICFLVLFSCISAISQPIVQRGSATITVVDARMGATYNMLMPRYSDTTEANTQIGIDSCGAIIFTYTGNTAWFRQCSPKKWVVFGSTNGNNNIDTIYTRLPIYVDYTSQPGKRIISFLQPNGVISGGLVTVDSCMTLGVTPVTYSLNYIQFNIGQTLALVVAAADPTFDRIDAVIVDSFGVVSILTGTPSATPIAPQINPSSQIILTTITVPAGSTCLTVGIDVIYDENTGAPEWTPTTSGTINADEDNTANPYHLTKADFVVTYTNGSQLIFTKTGVADTVKGGDIFKFYLYILGDFTNQIQAQWLNGTTAVSNNLVINPYFNVHDSNQYQLVVVPFSAWSFTGGNVYNKLVITFAGDDVSGAKGLYFDWIQVQQGLTNVEEPPPPAWLISGNNDATPPANFLGTTNAVGLMFKVNNVQSGYLDMNFNTSLGRFSAVNMSTGFSNVALGYAALFSNTTGNHNIGVGYKSLNFNTTGFRNTAVGYEALYNNTTGSYNIGLGYQFDDTNHVRSKTLSISDSTNKFYFKALDSAAGTAPNILGLDPATGLIHRYATPTGNTYTASEGLQLSTNDFQLGASTALAAPTFTTGRFINAGTNQLTITGTSGTRLQLTSTTTGGGINVNTQTGTAVSANANGGGTALSAASVGTSGAAISAAVNNSSDASTVANFSGGYASLNTIVPTIQLYRGTNISGGAGASAAGLGTSIDFRLGGASGGSIQPSGLIINKWTSVAAGNFDAQMEFWNAKATTRRRNMAITTDGGIILDQYVTGSNDGGVAADSVLVVTSTGIVKKRDAASFGGGGGTETMQETFDNSVAALDNPTIQLGGNNFSILNDAYGLQIQSTGDNVDLVDLAAQNETGLGNGTHFNGNALDVSAAAFMQAFFNDGDKSAKIDAFADATTSTITHTADTSIFNGNINYNGNAKLLADRTIDLNGKVLSFNSSIDQLLLIDPVLFESNIKATDGTSNATLNLKANSGGDFSFEIYAGSATILGDGTTNTITHTADTHIFNGGMLYSYTAQTGTYAILPTDYFIDCTSGTFTVTLPTAVGATGHVYIIKNSGAGTITIATTSAQTIDGVTTKTLSVQYSSYSLISDNANWKLY